MSRRKQAAIAAAQAAQQKQSEEEKKHSFFARLKNKRFLVLGSAAFILITGLIAVSATANGKTNSTWFNAIVGGNAAPVPAAVTPMPSPVPTPQLSKEYIYAGSRMLAVEDANAPVSNNQPTDLVVWRLVNGAGEWYIRDSTDGTFTSGVFGATGDVPKPADFDGDGLYDFCVYRPNHPSSGLGTFFVQPSSGGSFYGVQFGISSDVPVPADYDGDGRADAAVYRPSNNTYYIKSSSNNSVQSLAIGQTGSTPLPADYDGDGRVDPAVYKLLGNNTYEWTIYRSTTNQLAASFPYGDVPNGDVPATGDFNGDGVFDVAVRRVGTNEWIVQSIGSLSMNISGFTMQPADVPVAGDYDGDGKTDAAVWRPSNGTWYIRKSSNNQMRVDQWGQNSDTPVPAPFRR